jgi:sugar phosphate isomerase/epimerase
MGWKLSYAISVQKTKFEAVATSHDLLKKIEQMKKQGFDGVELAIRDVSRLNYLDLKKALKNTGLEVPAIGTGQIYLEEGLSLSNLNQKIREKTVERLYDHIKLASNLGSIVIIGLVRGNLSKNKNSNQRFQESLADCLEFAAKKNVVLGIEPLNRYESNFMNTIIESVDFIKKMEEMGYSNLKLIADSFHMNIEEKDFNESLVKAAPWLAHVHISDSNRCFPGSGHINFQGIIKTLKSLNYNGFISGESLPKPTELDAMEGFLKYMREYI